MGESSPGTPTSVRPPDDRLDSWKEIAAYLDRDVTTVQRWEKREGMPVRRHLHDRMGSVYAFRTDLDAWARSRNLRAAPEKESNAPSPNLSAAARSAVWRFLAKRALVFLRGEIQHKNLWLLDLRTGAERQLTNLSPDFEIGDFDMSRDGREVVLERVQERSDTCCWISRGHKSSPNQ